MRKRIEDVRLSVRKTCVKVCKMLRFPWIQSSFFFLSISSFQLFYSFFRSIFWLQTCPKNYYEWDFLSSQFNRTRPVYKIYRSNENNRYDEILLKHSWLYSLWGCHQRTKSAKSLKLLWRKEDCVKSLKKMYHGRNLRY